MALGYVILAHRNPHQLQRLLNVLAVGENTVALHIDARASKAVHGAAAEWARTSPQVKLIRPRPVAWGQFSLVEAQLDALRRLLANDVPRWSHVNLISAQDFPLHSQRSIEAELAAAPERSYISWFKPEEVWPEAERRICRYYLNTPRFSRALFLPGVGRRLRQMLHFEGGIVHLPKIRRRAPGFFRWYGGSNHVTLARAACEHVVRDPGAARIIHWLKYSRIPDESVFQSVLLNSRIPFDLVNDDRREITFAEGSPHPKVLTMADWDRLARSEKWFARKFDLRVDSEIIGRIEAHIDESESPQLRPSSPIVPSRPQRG